ncbi:cell wall hydrolase, SleB [Roseivivax marinus]|uniref:Cell wall hydrolase, SleB n=1 Tax=Roseivivax marinus TaxID=1379903 RepID=W4HPC3_9RHOB|nr:cell wall hydrolase [Roseivivax marinus]ETW14278.1 cell wall hydrolase, SleB [Roseivivax marinus]UMA66484.1 cell wall hydrolase [Roseivivax marinus]SEK75744.1 Cell Wall Hydrolase [Roseivivax marinus]
MTVRTVKLVAAAALMASLAACGGQRERVRIPLLQHSEVDCMARAMYFESIRSSRDGMVAVGSVVMNRVESDDFPDTVCGVVGQRNQFAPGVLRRSMDGGGSELARSSARAVLRGERHPMVQNARFFHAATYNAGYNNMHYVLSTGGNAFYEKRRPHLVTRPSPPRGIEGVTGR